MGDVKSVFVQVIEKPARKVIIKRGIQADDYFAYCGEVGCDVWGILTSMQSLSGEPVCLWLPERYRDILNYIRSAHVTVFILTTVCNHDKLIHVN